MTKELKKLFENIVDLNPPAKLAEIVLAKIEGERIKKAKRKILFSYFGFMSSFVLAIYVGINFGQTFLHSEFWMILHLAFSDIFVVISNWNSFGYSLLETFPIVHAVALLLPVFTLLISINFYLTNKYSLIRKYNI